MLHALKQGDLAGIGCRLFNVFEEVLAPMQQRDVETIKNILIQAGALGATMSGSGPTVLGLFDQEAPAQQALTQLKALYKEVFLARPV